MNYSLSLYVRKAISGLGLGLFLLLFCQSALAQSNLGRISGTITDQSGGAVANASVTVVDVERGINRPLTTDESGAYSAGSLIPGTYSVRAEATGFRAIDRRDILVNVGGDVRVDLTLQPGAQSETITVTGELPMINTSNATLGGQIENTVITEIPLNGRNFQHLLDYKPGMVSGASGNANTHASNGNRTDANVWVIDGLYSGDLYTGWSVVNGKISGGGADPSTTLPLDGILELNIQSQPKAEWGYKPGGVVQVGLKSGTNTMHGTLFAFGRDKAFNARNAFNPSPAPENPYAMTQWGGSIGGPIKRDKLFYFGSVEIWDYAVGAAVDVNAPSTQPFAVQDPTNSIPDALYRFTHDAAGLPNPNNLPGPNQVLPSQLSLNLAGCQTAAATPAAIAAAASPAAVAALCAGSSSPSVFNNFGSTGQTNLSFPTVGGSKNYMIKTDYHHSSNHSFNAEYFIGNGRSLAWRETTQPYWRVNALLRSQLGRGVWIWTPSSTLLNEARIGYNRLRARIVNNDCVEGPDWAADYDFIGNSDPTDPALNLSYPTYACAFPLTTISGFGTLNQQNGSGPVFTDPWNLQYLDSLSWTRGNHQFKFGGEYHQGHFTGTGGGGPGPGVKGILTFGTTDAFAGDTPLQSFLAGKTSTAQVQVGPIVRDISIYYLAGFVQDDWRVTPRITLNLGLRYEYQSPYRDKNNLIGNFDQSFASGMRQQTDELSVYNGDKNNFSPRVGVAWDLTGKGTTVVRAAGSVLYSATNFSPFSEIQTVPTGGTISRPDGTTFAAGGDNVTAQISQNNGFIWQAGQEVFSFGSAADVKCGNGQPALVFTPDADGAGPLLGGWTATGATNPAPCTLFAIDQNLYTPYVTNWSLGIQQALGSRVSLDIAYVGNHATGLRAYGDLNQPTQGALNSGSSQQNRRPYTSNCPAVPAPAQGVVVAPAIGNATIGGAGTFREGGGCFPWLANVNYFSNTDMANYSALQVGMTMRNFRGLTAGSAFTFQRAPQQYDGNENTITNSPSMSYSRPRLDYGHTGNPWNFAGTINYQVPGRPGFGQMMQGWGINMSYSLRGPAYVTPIDTTNDVSGTGTRRDRWSMVGDGDNIVIGGLNRVPCFGVGAGSSAAGRFAQNGCTTVAAGSGVRGDASYVANMPSACVAAAIAQPAGPVSGIANSPLGQLARLGCFYQNGTAIVPPAQGNFGTMGVGALHGGTYRNVNLSITKTWSFRERYTAQFRAEIHNLFNRTQYGGGSLNYSNPGTNGPANGTPNVGDGIVVGDGGARGIQLGLKLGF